jgi:hypothetical protein
MLDSDRPPLAAWSPRSEGVGVALWTSFIVACLETTIVFAFLDPVTLGFEGLAPTLVALRPILYGCGFFFFWSFAFLGAGLTAYMFESGPHAGARAPGSGDSTSAKGAPSRDPPALS